MRSPSWIRAARSGPTSFPGLFPLKLLFPPLPISKGKALGTRLGLGRVEGWQSERGEGGWAKWKRKDQVFVWSNDNHNKKVLQSVTIFCRSSGLTGTTGYVQRKLEQLLENKAAQALSTGFWRKQFLLVEMMSCYYRLPLSRRIFDIKKK